MSFRYLSAVLVLAISAGCSDDDPAVHLTTAEVTATARLKSVTHPKWGDIVWANLSIKGVDKTLVAADIDCFALHIGESVSGELWVDSFVDISRGDYPARIGEVSVAVYWPMKDFAAGTDADLVQGKLVLLPKFSGASCFKFSVQR
jgi:hypothetical protein